MCILTVLTSPKLTETIAAVLIPLTPDGSKLCLKHSSNSFKSMPMMSFCSSAGFNFLPRSTTFDRPIPTSAAALRRDACGLSV